VKTLIAMLKHHEGVRYVPYRCPARLWTVGVGHVIDPAHLRVPFDRRLDLSIPPGWDRRLTEEEVDALLQEDLQRFLPGVLRLCAVEPLSNRHLALASFAFNVGLGNLQNSTLRMKHNRGEFLDAADEFKKWNLSAGKVLAGLVTRRNDERALYLTERS
jgi:GH24 family phage-related lysozyme (muramidase)